MSKHMAERKVENPDDEFGVAAGETSAVGGGEGGGVGEKGKWKGKDEGGGLEFLKYVTCSICGHPFYSKNEADRKFWMTSCGHILCGAREHNHQKGRCTKCRKEEIETYPVDIKMLPELRTWFGNPMDNNASVVASLKRTVEELEVGSLAVATFQTQELMRLIKLLRLADERKEENIKLVKAELQKMGMMKKELVEVKAQLTDCQAKNEELIRENEQLRSNQSQPLHQSRVPYSSYPQQPFNPLTPVREEEGEEGVYHDSGPQSIQRFELNLAEQRGRQGFDQYTTPRHMPTRLTLPPTDRPSTTEPSHAHEARLSRSGPSSINLEKFRMADSSGLGLTTPHSTHPYARPSSAMASRPGSARPFVTSRTGGFDTGMSSRRQTNGGFTERGKARPFVPTGDAYASSSQIEQQQPYQSNNTYQSGPYQNTQDSENGEYYSQSQQQQDPGDIQY